MKRSFVAALVYLILGLSAGVFYREFTKSHGFTEQQDSQLSVVHTHFLTLGFIMFLIVILLDKQFEIAQDSLFNIFFYSYNAGLLVAGGTMVVRGVQTVLGLESTPAIAGIAGLGHILLALGMGALLWSLGSIIFKKPA